MQKLDKNTHAGLVMALLRHGQSEGNVKRLWEGARSDSPLTALGEKQAEATGEHLAAGMAGARIYCSPLQRARKTAERIAKYTDSEIEVIEDLIEIDWGELEGMTTKQVGEKFPEVLQHWGTKLSSPLPGGDAAMEVGKRTASALERIVEREVESGRVVVVSHQGAIAMGLMYLLKKKDKFEEFQLPNCAVHSLQFNAVVKAEELASIDHLISRGIESKKWSF
ncbi:MAG: histidine phosphatase family protein [Anaerolineae bacterium]|nr:histidine phosphatase family protein [Anaerolineae bacterium]